jgi:hypothetical protein
MELESAVVLSRAGNCAVVQLPGRAFPGSMFRAIRSRRFGPRCRRRLASSAGPGNDEALDELDHAVQEMEAIVVLYEEALSERGIRLPY